MTLYEVEEARLRAAITEVAAQMPGLSGPEQAYLLGGACARAGINPTWGELHALLHSEPMRSVIEREHRRAKHVVAPGD